MAKNAIDLDRFEKFCDHSWIARLVPSYNRSATIGKYSVARLLSDLEEMNEDFVKERGRVAFTSAEGRVKTRISYFRKLFDLARKHSLEGGKGLTQQSIEQIASDIKDLCGVRFACPYYDEVVWAVNGFVRPRLSVLGYSTDLTDSPKTHDSDYLDQGNDRGYRSYHFFVEVPTDIDIFGNSELVTCEVQARTELQHVWATKSHDLLYKPTQEWDFRDPHVLEDMRQVSNALRSADQFLIGIRDRVRNNQESEG